MKASFLKKLQLKVLIIIDRGRWFGIGVRRMNQRRWELRGAGWYASDRGGWSFWL
jgi:hypothetical protein